MALAVVGCAPTEPKPPDPEGVVVLEVAAPSAAPSAPKPSATAAPVKPSDLDIESCIALVRSDPFPNGPTDPSGGDLYLAALAAEKRANMETARKLYFDLVQRFRTSSYTPLAYFAFGEMFRADAATDPSKIEFAKQSYEEALKYPPSGNPIFEIATLRRAELSAMAGDGTQVMSTLLKIGQGPLGRCAEPLGQTVASMLPPAYAAAGQPGKAAMFFSRFGSQEAPTLLTLRLARLYVTQQKKGEAIAALAGLPSTIVASASTCSELVALAQELGDAKLATDLGGRCRR